MIGVYCGKNIVALEFCTAAYRIREVESLPNTALLDQDNRGINTRNVDWGLEQVSGRGTFNGHSATMVLGEASCKF